MFGYIYLTTNTANGKKYIGEHRGQVKDKYYIGSGRVLQEAIRKYGKDKFTCEIIEWCETEEIMHEREIYWIAHYNAVESDAFYNLDKGGVGTHIVSKSASQKMSEAKLGKTPWNKGKKMSDEQRKRLSEVLKGRKSWALGRTKDNDARIAKRSHPLSEERKQHMHNVMIGRPSKLKGTTLSEEHKQKIRDSKKNVIFTEEHKKKLSLAKGTRVLCVETGIIYNSLLEAAQAVGYKSSNPIANQLSGKLETAGGYHWKKIAE